MPANPPETSPENAPENSAENAPEGAAIRPGHLFCFGLGYSAERLARRLLGWGWTISGTVRSRERAASLSATGIKAIEFDGTAAIPDANAAFRGITHVLASIPPGRGGDPGLRFHGPDLARQSSLSWFGYLSTPAVYGDRAGGLVDEDATLRPGSERGHRRLAAERGWIAAFQGSAVAAQIFRLSGIYGPGRNMLDQLRAAKARIIDKPGQVFNRIHVDDIGLVLLASMARPRGGAIYNVADTLACPSGDVVRYAASLLGMKPPDPIDFATASLSPMAQSFYSECKRLDTTRLGRELGVTLAFPTYREGLAQILADEEEA